MINRLRCHKFYQQQILAVLPLLAVSSTLKTGLLLLVLTLSALVVSTFSVYGLGKIVSEKTAGFAGLIIAVGTVGVLATIFSISFADALFSVGLYVGISAFSATLMVRNSVLSSSGIPSTRNAWASLAMQRAKLRSLQPQTRSFLTLKARKMTQKPRF